MVKFVIGSVVFCGGSLAAFQLLHGWNIVSVVCVAALAVVGSAIAAK